MFNYSKKYILVSGVYLVHHSTPMNFSRFKKDWFDNVTSVHQNINRTYFKLNKTKFSI